MTLAERLAGKLVAGPSGCLEFQGARVRGYGRIRAGGKTLLAHRVAWELAGNELSPAVQVLHRCDNPPCCNPDHLFVGDDSANRIDMARKGRGRNGSLPYGVGRNGNNGYFARVYLGGEPVYLGTFGDPGAAGRAAREAKEAYYGATQV